MLTFPDQDDSLELGVGLSFRDPSRRKWAEDTVYVPMFGNSGLRQEYLSASPNW